jgi:hypothetical protein
MNSQFAAWFFPVIIIAGSLWLYQNNKRQSADEIALRKEINLRIKFAKNASFICQNYYVNPNDPENHRLDLESNNNLYHCYLSSISNVLLPNPVYFGIDSVEYDGGLRNNSLYNLCSKLSALSNRSQKNIKAIQDIIDSLKIYLKYHGSGMDSATYYYYYMTINGGLKQLN